MDEINTQETAKPDSFKSEKPLAKNTDYYVIRERETGLIDGFYSNKNSSGMARELWEKRRSSFTHIIESTKEPTSIPDNVCLIRDYQREQPELCSGDGKYYTNKSNPKNPNRKRTPYRPIDLDEVFQMAFDPQAGIDKDQAQWLIPSTLMSRSRDQQLSKGEFHILWADYDGECNKDTSPLTIGEIKDSVKNKILSDHNPIRIYTSRSATYDCQKSRILIELKSPLSGTDFEICQKILNDKLEAEGIFPDRATQRANQVLYLPNKGEYYEYKCDIALRNNLFDPLNVWANEIKQERSTTMAAQRKAYEHHELVKLKHKSTANNGKTLIEVFNQTHAIEDILIQAGYAQKADTFRHPKSESGSFSASIDPKTGRVHSLSSADPLYTEGGGVGAHDAFSAFQVLFHNNDCKAALRDAGDNWVTLGGESWNKVKQREYAQEKSATQTLTIFENNTEASMNNTLTWHSGDSMASKAKPANYLINNIIETESHGILEGQSMAFKSFVALKMAHSICTGESFFGQEIFTTGKVLYICGEGKGSISRRLKALQLSSGGFQDNLRLLEEHISIDEPSDMNKLREAIAGLSPVLVIFDTYASLASQTNENANDEVSKCLRLIKETCQGDGSTSSLIVHHQGKDTRLGSRGASAFLNNIDFSFELKRDNRAPMLTTLSCKKMKDGGAFKDIIMEAAIVELGFNKQDGTPETSLVMHPSSVQAPTPRAQLTTTEQSLMDALRHVARNCAEAPSYEIRTRYAMEGRKVIPTDIWRKEALERILVTCNSDKDSAQKDAKRKAFKRGVEGLKKKDQIHTHGDYVWNQND